MRGKSITLAVAVTGRVGLVAHTGIATDSFNQHFFVHLVEGAHLVSLLILRTEKTCSLGSTVVQSSVYLRCAARMEASYPM